MTDTLKYQLADKMTPTTGIPEWYFAVVIVAILVGFLGWSWISYKKSQTDTSTAPAPTKAPTPERREVREGDSAEMRALERIITAQMDSLKEVLNVRLQAIEERVETRLEEFKESLDKNEEREEVRMGELRTQMENGFRAVHKRIDNHVDKVAEGD